MELVHKNEWQRFYKVDFDIEYCFFWGEKKKVSELLKEVFTEKNKTGESIFNLPNNLTVEQLIEKSKRLVCVSDAKTHIERLVFGALFFEDSQEYGRLPLLLDGKHTWMTQGGDENEVYDDEVYIRHLRKINNKQQ